MCVGGVSGSELAARHQCVWGGLVAQSLQQDISVWGGGGGSGSELAARLESH